MPHCNKIVAEAREWLGTPFRHQGRKKGVGCDCIGMVLGALHLSGARSRHRDKAGNPLPLIAFDRTDYAPDPNSNDLRDALARQFQPVPAAQVRAGDVVLFKIIRLPQHVGIVADHPCGEGLSLIHAYSGAGMVVEETLTDSWLSRCIAAYRIPAQCFGDNK